MSHVGCVTQGESQQDIGKDLKFTEITPIRRSEISGREIYNRYYKRNNMKISRNQGQIKLPGSQTETKAECGSAVSHHAIKRHGIDVNIFYFVTPFQSFAD